MRRTALQTLFIAATSLCAVNAMSYGKVIYVNDDATAPGDGTSWATAYRFLQDGLSDANSATESVEIRVAGGLYRPDQGTGHVLGDTGATFQINRSLILLGGFAGPQAEDPNHRDTSVYRTVLTGDLEGNDRRDLPEPLPASSEWIESRTDNSLCVVTVHPGEFVRPPIEDPNRRYAGAHRIVLTSDLERNDRCQLPGPLFASSQRGNSGVGDSLSTAIVQIIQDTVVLDGVTITGGECSYCPHVGGCRDFHSHIGEGGGIYSFQSNLLLRDCAFEFNGAAQNGGALHSEGGTCRVEGSTFHRNRASTGGAITGSGGCMALVNNRFTANFAGLGGAIHGLNCEFLDVSNCLLAGNAAHSSGSAVSALGCNLNLTLCTVASNGPGIALLVRCDERAGRVEIDNCIFSNGLYEIHNGPGISTRVNHSLLGPDRVWDPCEAVIWYGGNIDLEPVFVSPGYWSPETPMNESDPGVWIDGDFHLKSQAGRWDPASESWVQDEITSPCIDAGDPNSPVGAEPYPNGDIINMGFYGGTAEASKSYLAGVEGGDTMGAAPRID